MAIFYLVQLNPQELPFLPTANRNTARPVMIETDGASDNGPCTTVTVDPLSCLRTPKSDDCQRPAGINRLTLSHFEELQ